MVKYITVDDVRDFTKVTSTEYSDSAITKMIEYAESLIDERLASNFVSGGDTVTEYYDGTGTKFLILDNYPILSITSLDVDDDNDGTFEYSLTEGTDYEFDSWGRVTLTDDAGIAVFAKYVRNVKVIYKYGYSDVPSIIKYLATAIVANLIQRNAELQAEIDDLFNRLTKLRMTLA